MSDIFAVIADPTRRQILSAIAEGPKSVSDLVTLTGLEQPAVSKHLKSLRDAGLASVTAQGQSRLYSAETAPLVPVADFVNDLLGAVSDAGQLSRTLGEAGEKLGGWLAERAEKLGEQVQVKLAEVDVDANQLGRDLGRKLADAKASLGDLSAEKEAELRAELDAFVANLQQKVQARFSKPSTKSAAKPAAKPAAKTSAKPVAKPGAKKASSADPANPNTTIVKTVASADENEDEF